MKMVLRSLAAGRWTGLLAVDIIVALVMSQAAPAFMSSYNLYIVGRDVSVTLLVALSQMIVLAIGHMNVSVGAIGGLIAILVGGMMEKLGIPMEAAIGIGIVLGVLAGLLNGGLTLTTGINSFIITLATSIMFQGINLGITQGIPFYNLPAAFTAFGQARTQAFPHLGVPTLLVTVVLAVFLGRAVLGRQMLAVGGNLKAAQLSGVPVTRATLTAHGISGGLAAVAGILLMARLGSAQPTIGADWVLTSFAGPIIGGAALTGGSVSVAGTTLAVVLVALIQNALVLINADPYWVQFLLGTLILGGVAVGQLGVGRGPAAPRIRALRGLAPASGSGAAGSKGLK
jgi:ribose transport system permease protein